MFASPLATSGECAPRSGEKTASPRATASATVRISLSFAVRIVFHPSLVARPKLEGRKLELELAAFLSGSSLVNDRKLD
jgi:hypothetical protein